MKKVPISLIIDDPAPVLSVYYTHSKSNTTADGREGEIIRVLDTNGWPILITHWQSLISNGLGTGLRALDEVGRRIGAHLSDRVEWMNFEEIMHYTIRLYEEDVK